MVKHIRINRFQKLPDIGAADCFYAEKLCRLWLARQLAKSRLSYIKEQASFAGRLLFDLAKDCYFNNETPIVDFYLIAHNAKQI